MKIAEAFVEVRADTSGFAPAVEKEAQSAAEKAKSSFKQLLVGAAVGIFAKGAFDELQTAQRSAKQLEQAIKLTGGAAGVSAKQASELADEISRSSVVSIDLVTNVERALLKFKDIQNTGIDKTFDRATQAAVDLGAAVGGDAVSAAGRLGKALNDPVKALTSLTKIGVTFTDAQKAQVRALVATGDAALAQSVILTEVESKFAGQAAASATEADKAALAYKNLQLQVGEALAPAIDDASRVVTFLSHALADQPPILQQIEIFTAAAAVGYAKFGPSVREAATSLRTFSSEATGLKGALGKAGLAGIIATAALAADEFVTSWSSAKLRNVSDDVEELSISLAELAANGTSDFDLEGLAAAFDTVGDSATRFAANPIFRLSTIGGGARSALKAAKEDIDAVDKSLANLVSSGQAGAARDQFQALTEGLEAQGVSADEIRDRFDDYITAVGKGGSASELAGIAAGEFGDEAEGAGRHIKNAAEQVQDFNDALDDYLGKALSTEEASDRIAQGFLDLADAVKEVVHPAGKQGLADFDADTEAGLQFRETIRGLVESYGDLIKTTGANQAESDLLAEAFRRQAVAIGVPKEVAEKYSKILSDIPPDAQTEIRQKNMAKALTETSELRRRLGDIDGKRVTASVDVDTSAADQHLRDLARRISGFGASGFDVAAFVQANRAAGGPLPEGLTLVGEEGPELVTKHGSQVDVFSNRQTRAAFAGGGGGGLTVNVTVNGAVGDRTALMRYIIDGINEVQGRRAG